jgi:hypothetical protein
LFTLDLRLIAHKTSNCVQANPFAGGIFDTTRTTFFTQDDDERHQLALRESIIEELILRGIINDISLNELFKRSEGITIFVRLWDRMGAKVGLESFISIISRYFFLIQGW